MGYINRGWDDNAYYSFGIGGINGRADFFNQNSPDDRRKELNVEVPRNVAKYHGYKNKLIVGQVTRDASVQHHDHAQWIRDMLKKYPDAVYREHPLQGHPVSGIGKKCSCDTLGKTIKKHEIGEVITFNSNSGVMSLLMGIPTVSMDQGSMTYDITSHDPDNVYWPQYKKLEQWLNNLCYAQWKPSEFSTTWERLIKCLQ